MATVAQLNRKIAQYGVECFKGDGYFYFMDLHDHTEQAPPPSVYTMRFTDLTLQQWVDYVKDHYCNNI